MWVSQTNAPLTQVSTDVFLATLEDLLAATASNIERAKVIRERIDQLRSQVSSGTSIESALANEPNPLIVELITENIVALQEVGARLRWAEASILREEGMSAADMARLFGVSRQRISALLNNPPLAAERPSA